MEREIESIRDIAAKQRELTVWEKFENHSEEYSRLTMEPPPKMNNTSSIWFTANMEYGRFQLANRGYPAAGAPPPPDVIAGDGGARPQSEGGQSYLSDKLDTEREPQSYHNNNNDDDNDDDGAAGEEHNPADPVPRCYLPIDLKYMAASRRGNRPAGDAGNNRLTTGYAKQYMAAENGRFWTNIQEVAPVAGYEVSAPLPASTQGSTAAAEVLTVD